MSRMDVSRGRAAARWCGVPVAVAVCLCCSLSRADRFTYVDARGQETTVEARLAGATRGVLALETADGRLRLVPDAAVLEREPGEAPTPLDESAVAALLREQFGADRFLVRVRKQERYVVGLVLASPLPGRFADRAHAFLNKASRFMRNVEGVFRSFSAEVRFPIKPPRFPLVVLIFESDADFEEYVAREAGDAAARAGSVAGFYSQLTNYLAIRLSECHTFETPLHEAIHQQAFNRGVFQRLAPVPAWFNEGMATGFEANGERINIGPFKISRRYARLAQSSHNLDWKTVVANDRAFRGDVLAGEAYAQAWCLHWLLLTEYTPKYVRYVQTLSTKQTLEGDQPEDRVRQFERIVGKSIAQLEQEFPEKLKIGLRKQGLTLDAEDVPASAARQDGLAEYRISAVLREDMGGVFAADGTLKNLSPFRPMSFHVTLETDAGTYAEWHVDRLDCGEEATLETQFTRQKMTAGPGGAAKSYRIRVRSALPDSQDARRWREGELPVPVFGA